ncbi:MAG: hypothetical protein WC413_02430 [Candidatus Nanoarchaeia archaeon]
MILFAEINFIFKLQPFANWYFPIIWFGYIFMMDALNYKFRKKSMLMNNKKLFFILLILSAAVWWMFEFINGFMGNWNYNTFSIFSNIIEKYVFATLSFSTVIPAIFETTDLLLALHLFNHTKLKKKYNITKSFIYILMFLGILCILLPLVLPKFTFPLIWLGFFLLLDPWNYMHKHPSIIGHLKDKKLTIPLTLFIGGTICGFFWEFWNYWAIPKWTYSVPYVGFLKIFEMPILGYLGYGPFALELYAMWHFVKGLLHMEKKN